MIAKQTTQTPAPARNFDSFNATHRSRNRSTNSAIITTHVHWRTFTAAPKGRFLLKGIPACRDELPAWVGDGKASDGSHLTRTGTSDQNISFEATFSLASMTCAFLLDLVLKHNVEHVARYCRHRGFQEIRHCLMLRPRSIDLLWCKLQWRPALVASADLL